MSCHVLLRTDMIWNGMSSHFPPPSTTIDDQRWRRVSSSLILDRRRRRHLCRHRRPRSSTVVVVVVVMIVGRCRSSSSSTVVGVVVGRRSRRRRSSSPLWGSPPIGEVQLDLSYPKGAPETPTHRRSPVGLLLLGGVSRPPIREISLAKVRFGSCWNSSPIGEV